MGADFPAGAGAVKDKDEIPVGETGWLRPQTKMAPAYCFRRLAAEILDYTHWPMVKVRIYTGDPVHEDGYHTMVVHRDNIVKNPQRVVKKKQGDQVGQDGDEEGESKVRVLPGKPKPLDPECGYEEQVLF